MAVDDCVYEIWYCSHCRTFFQNPMPSRDELAAFYRSRDGAAYAAHLAAPPPHVTRWSRALSKRADSALARVAATMMGIDNRILDLMRSVRSPVRRVLDVGCGNGYFAALVADHLKVDPNGVLGIDITPDLERPVRNRGFRFRCTRLEHLDERDFDIVIMSHVLEHEPDPRAYLREAHRRIRDGGLLLLSVPNARSVPARIFGRRWICHSVPRHLYNFSKDGVLRLAAGLFEVEAYSAGDWYTFMFAAYYPRAVARSVRLLSPVMPLVRAALYVTAVGDNQSFVLRKAAQSR